MIAEHAGVTDPALYYYFPTKRELHDALLRAPDTGDIPPPGGTLDSAIETFAAFFMRYAENGDLVRLSLQEQMSGQPAALRFRRQTDETFRTFIRPFLRQHYGEAAASVEDIVVFTLSGAFWDAILRYGPRFEEVVREQAFQSRLRDLLLACMPEAAEAGR